LPSNDALRQHATDSRRDISELFRGSLALRAGVDAYITGEVSEQTVHFARETGIHFFAAGHHATERYGVQAVAAHLVEKFGLDHQFIDIDNPV